MFEYHIMESQIFKFTATTLSGDNAQQFELHWDTKEVHRYTKTSGEGFPRISEGSVVLFFFGSFPYPEELQAGHACSIRSKCLEDRVSLSRDLDLG